MKVLGICCGRINGNTEMMMKEAFRAIEAGCGAQCELLRLQQTEVKSCVGCETCVMNHLKGDADFRCIHSRGSDHLYFVEQKLRAADAVIVSAPTYNMMPPGILIRFLNRLHGTGDYADVTQADPKIGATFTIGGSDWTNYTLPIANMITMYLTGSFETIVDKCHFDFLPAPGAVVLEEEMLERVRLLGRRVAQALLDKAEGRRPAYAGDPGLCPDCHGTLLEKRSDGWYCPQCLTRVELTMDGGEVKAVFSDAERAKNRCGAWGQELHIKNIQRCHKKAADHRAEIAEKQREYAALGSAVEMPELDRE